MYGWGTLNRQNYKARFRQGDNLFSSAADALRKLENPAPLNPLFNFNERESAPTQNDVRAFEAPKPKKKHKAITAPENSPHIVSKPALYYDPSNPEHLKRMRSGRKRRIKDYKFDDNGNCPPPPEYLPISLPNRLMQGPPNKKFAISAMATLAQRAKRFAREENVTTDDVEDLRTLLRKKARRIAKADNPDPIAVKLGLEKHVYAIDAIPLPYKEPIAPSNSKDDPNSNSTTAVAVKKKIKIPQPKPVAGMKSKREVVGMNTQTSLEEIPKPGPSKNTPATESQGKNNAILSNTCNKGSGQPQTQVNPSSSSSIKKKLPLITSSNSTPVHMQGSYDSNMSVFFHSEGNMSAEDRVKANMKAFEVMKAQISGDKKVDKLLRELESPRVQANMLTFDAARSKVSNNVEKISDSDSRIKSPEDSLSNKPSTSESPAGNSSTQQTDMNNYKAFESAKIKHASSLDNIHFQMQSSQAQVTDSAKAFQEVWSMSQSSDPAERIKASLKAFEVLKCQANKQLLNRNVTLPDYPTVEPKKLQSPPTTNQPIQTNSQAGLPSTPDIQDPSVCNLIQTKKSPISQEGLLNNAIQSVSNDQIQTKQLPSGQTVQPNKPDLPNPSASQMEASKLQNNQVGLLKSIKKPAVRQLEANKQQSNQPRLPNKPDLPNPSTSQMEANKLQSNQVGLLNKSIPRPAVRQLEEANKQQSNQPRLPNKPDLPNPSARQMETSKLQNSQVGLLKSIKKPAVCQAEEVNKLTSNQPRVPNKPGVLNPSASNSIDGKDRTSCHVIQKQSNTSNVLQSQEQLHSANSTKSDKIIPSKNLDPLQNALQMFSGYNYNVQNADIDIDNIPKPESENLQITSESNLAQDRSNNSKEYKEGPKNEEFQHKCSSLQKKVMFKIPDRQIPQKNNQISVLVSQRQDQLTAYNQELETRNVGHCSSNLLPVVLTKSTFKIDHTNKALDSSKHQNDQYQNKTVGRSSGTEKVEDNVNNTNDKNDTIQISSGTGEVGCTVESLKHQNSDYTNTTICSTSGTEAVGCIVPYRRGSHTSQSMISTNTSVNTSAEKSFSQLTKYSKETVIPDLDTDWELCAVNGAVHWRRRVQRKAHLAIDSLPYSRREGRPSESNNQSVLLKPGFKRRNDPDLQLENNGTLPTVKYDSSRKSIQENMVDMAMQALASYTLRESSRNKAYRSDKGPTSTLTVPEPAPFSRRERSSAVNAEQYPARSTRAASVSRREKKPSAPVSTEIVSYPHPETIRNARQEFSNEIVPFSRTASRSIKESTQDKLAQIDRLLNSEKAKVREVEVPFSRRKIKDQGEWFSRNTEKLEVSREIRYDREGPDELPGSSREVSCEKSKLFSRRPKTDMEKQVETLLPFLRRGNKPKPIVLEPPPQPIVPIAPRSLAYDVKRISEVIIEPSNQLVSYSRPITSRRTPYRFSQPLKPPRVKYLPAAYINILNEVDKSMYGIMGRLKPNIENTDMTVALVRK